MSRLIELGSATANHLTFHFRLFTSNGTSPDTGASSDSIIAARGSTTTFTPNVLVTAVHAAQGMYSVQLLQSNVSNLGGHALYHTQGDFPQHVANFEVVNSNPYSTQSNILNIGNLDATVASRSVFSSTDSVGLKAQVHSGATVGINNIAAGNYSGVTISGVTATNVLDKSGYGVTSIAAGTYSGVTVGSVATLLPGTYSGVTVGVNNLAPGTYSAVTVSVSNIAPGNYSGVTISGVTATNVLDKAGYGVTSIAAGTYSGVTVGSHATLVSADYTSKVTVGTGGFGSGILTTANIAVGAFDATVFSTSAEQAFADRLLLRSINGGSDSGRSVGQAFYVLRNRVDASSSIGTVYQTDDATSAWTFSNSTGAHPISAVDPS